MCGPMQRMSEGPRPADLDPDTNRLQQAVLGLAKDNQADEIRELITSQGLSAAYGNQVRSPTHGLRWFRLSSAALLVKRG